MQEYEFGKNNNNNDEEEESCLLFFQFEGMARDDMRGRRAGATCSCECFLYHRLWLCFEVNCLSLSYTAFPQFVIFLLISYGVNLRC